MRPRQFAAGQASHRRRRSRCRPPRARRGGQTRDCEKRSCSTQHSGPSKAELGRRDLDVPSAAAREEPPGRRPAMREHARGRERRGVLGRRSGEASRVGEWTEVVCAADAVHLSDERAGKGRCRSDAEGVSLRRLSAFNRSDVGGLGLRGRRTLSRDRWKHRDASRGLGYRSGCDGAGRRSAQDQEDA